MVFVEVLYTVKEGFEAPPEAVHEAGNPRIWVLVIEGRRRVQKEKWSGGGMLRHGRDVHPTWDPVDNVTATLRVWDSKSTKSDEDLA